MTPRFMFFLFHADEMPTAGLLPALPSREIYAGLVPDVENFAALGRVLAKGLSAQPFQNVRVVFFFALADGQMTQSVATQVQGVEMADGILGAVDGRVMSDRAMPTAIARVEIEVRQFGVGRRSIRQDKGQALAQKLNEFVGQFQAPRTFEGFEVIGAGRALGKLESVFLEERPTGRQFVKDSIQAQMNPRGIGQGGAIAPMPAVGKQFMEWGEKGGSHGPGGSRGNAHRVGKNVLPGLSTTITIV